MISTGCIIALRSVSIMYHNDIFLPQCVLFCVTNRCDDRSVTLLIELLLFLLLLLLLPFIPSSLVLWLLLQLLLQSAGVVDAVVADTVCFVVGVGVVGVVIVAGSAALDIYYYFLLLLYYHHHHHPPPPHHISLSDEGPHPLDCNSHNHSAVEVYPT
mmetsp:Transcript_28571/g.32053  ORF Transcript_28571/g.32053 Transcript_28571/m.32053 type:complete len:157 (+) Transcript_28571:123-593(+)